jgi:8-oxo-dGTP pyrophosphatase MutT (NUDIX family)
MEKILKSETIFQGKKFAVKRVEVELESGEVAEWEIVDKGGDSVALVPVDADGNLYLVAEYFAATNERSLCLPKGTVSKGEDPEEAALREMAEEIGMTGRLERLARMSVSPGYLTQRTIVFLASDLVPATAMKDEKHHLMVVKVPLSDAGAKIASGEISEARTIGGIGLVQMRLSEVAA